MLRPLWLVGGLACALFVSGCPQGSELENPTPPTGGATATGGAAPTGGTTATGGATPTGGAGATTGGAGGAGGGASGTAGGGGTPFGLPDAGCNYVEILTRTCSSGTCHRATLPSAGLNLTPGADLLTRVYNVPAQHRQIVCPDLTACMPPAMTPCPACTMCPTGDFLIKPNDPANSWMMKKVDQSVPGGTAKVEIGCGAAMPTPSMDFTYSAADKTCLQAMVTAFANSGGM